VRAGFDVCAVFEGHHGILVRASHAAIRMARTEGYRAGMLPGVSALDCLLADLGIDPAIGGCQLFDADDFLLHYRQLNTGCHVILWQIAGVGDPDYSSARPAARNLPILTAALQEIYGADYEVVLYQAAKYPVCPPAIQRLPLSRLTPADVTAASTLYIPPKEAPRVDPVMAERLGLPGNPTTRRQESTPIASYQPSLLPSRLAEALSDLSRNPRLLAAFNRDPTAAVERYNGLTAAERAALASRGPRRIRLALLGEADPAGPPAPVLPPDGALP
ncbi:MAG: hypothetical protein ACRDG4_10990, partial [Chloroflexota bacterium]